MLRLREIRVQTATATSGVCDCWDVATLLPSRELRAGRIAKRPELLNDALDPCRREFEMLSSGHDIYVHVSTHPTNSSCLQAAVA